MRSLGKLLLTLFMCLPAESVRADRIVTYAIDPEQTQIIFNWIYMGITSPDGRFSQASGHIYGNLDRPETSWVDVSIPVRTLRTFMPVIDRTLLHSGDYFKVREHPEMRFRSTSIMHVDKEGREFSLIGELTVNGITRPVILSAKAGKGGGNPFADGGLTASTSFRRSEFGMNKMLGVVGDEMKVSLRVRAVEVKNAPPPVTAGK